MLTEPGLGEGEGIAEDRLRAIRILTDAELGHLKIEEFLSELLDRVSEILSTDTAAILLLENSGQLVARAARGLEEEVRQGVRIPLRQGFAGRIASEKRPIVLDRVDHTTVANPILWEKGIRAMVGVPLLSGGRVLGVLHVGTVGDRKFTEEDVELLQLVADRVAGATQVRLMEVERTASEVLQRSLLPSDLPDVPGMEFSARYTPAERARGVGGDWYDVFMVPSGQLWVVTGDVAGHGLNAAIVMGRLRSAIRSFTLTSDQPDEVLARTDQSLQHFDPGQLATVVCAAFRPPFDEVRVSKAGHPPPLLAAPDEPATYIDLESDPPLGTAAGLERSSRSVTLVPGAVVFFYTDGLIERRGESLDVGLERLRQALKSDHPNTVCQRVMGLLVSDTVPEDDIALVAVRRASTIREHEWPSSETR